MASLQFGRHLIGIRNARDVLDHFQVVARSVYLDVQRTSARYQFHHHVDVMKSGPCLNHDDVEYVGSLLEVTIVSSGRPIGSSCESMRDGCDILVRSAIGYGSLYGWSKEFG